MVIAYVVSLICLWLEIPVLALILQLTGLTAFICQHVLYFHFIDRFTTPAVGRNVYGVIEPTGTARRCVIFSGHHDSAHIYNFFEDFPSIFMVREVIFLIIYLSKSIWLIVIHVQHGLHGIPFSPRSHAEFVALVVFTVGVLGVLPMWRFLNEAGTPGAGDNLVSSCMGLTLAKYFSGAEKLKHTRLMFVSFDAEELGLRGSHAFFARHRDEFHEVKTWHFNVDCPYVADELKFLSADINGLCPLSLRMARRLVEIAHRFGYKKAITKGIMFLGGGTDAAEAARNGIEATTLLGMPYAPRDCHGNSVVYHSRKDTIDSVEKGLVEGTMGIFIEFVRQVDEGEFPGE
jgi:hypothetical protein